MKKTLLILIAVLLLIPSAQAAQNWTNYPFVTTPAPSDTLMTGTATTNRQWAVSNLLAMTGTNAQAKVNAASNSLAALIITTSNGIVSVITSSTNGLAHTNFVNSIVNSTSNSLAAMISARMITNANFDALGINNGASLTNLNADALFGTVPYPRLGNTNNVRSDNTNRILFMVGTNTPIWTNTLPMGTLSASTAAANYVLVTDGTGRNWTNYLTLAGFSNSAASDLVGTVTTRSNVFIRISAANTSSYQTNFIIQKTNLVFEHLTQDNGSLVFTLLRQYYGGYGGANGWGIIGRSDRSRQAEFVAGDGSSLGYVGSDGALRVFGFDTWSSGSATATLGMFARWVAVTGLSVNTNLNVSGSLTVTNGTISVLSNGLPAITVTSPWTNTYGKNWNCIPMGSLITVSKNGVTWMSGLSGAITVPTKPGEIVTFTGTAVAEPQ